MVTFSVTLGDLYAQATPISTIYIAFHIFVALECRDVKFGEQVDHCKSQPMDDKLSLKGAWSHHMTHFKILVLHNLSLEQLKLETLNSVQGVP